MYPNNTVNHITNIATSQDASIEIRDKRIHDVGVSMAHGLGETLQCDYNINSNLTDEINAFRIAIHFTHNQLDNWWSTMSTCKRESKLDEGSQRCDRSILFINWQCTGIAMNPMLILFNDLKASCIPVEIDKNVVVGRLWQEFLHTAIERQLMCMPITPYVIDRSYYFAEEHSKRKPARSTHLRSFGVSNHDNSDRDDMSIHRAIPKLNLSKEYLEAIQYRQTLEERDEVVAIGKQIRDLRKMYGYSISRLARALDIDKEMILAVENGDGNSDTAMNLLYQVKALITPDASQQATT